MAGVLGCAEDGDGVGGLGVVLTGDGGDLPVDPETPDGGDQQDDAEQSAEEESAASGVADWRERS